MLMDVHQRGDLRFPQSLPEFRRLFPDDAACAAYLEKAVPGLPVWASDGCGGSADEERAQLLLERLGLTRCGDLRIDRLSTRDRRIVALARALMQEPDIVLADDLTEGLDAGAAHEVMRLLVDSCAERNLAAIVCIHNVRIARTFLPRLVALRDGVIAHDGAARDVAGEVLRSVYGREYWNGAMTGVTEHARTAAPLTSDTELRDRAARA
jgi:phosphonate transport system ATP-binding protein